MSQILAVLSMLPVARRRPSGLNATPSTPLVWPRSVKTSWPVSVSQSLTVRSKLEVAIRRPSGLKATADDVRGVAAEREDLLAVAGSKTRTSPADRSAVLLHAASHRPSGLNASPPRRQGGERLDVLADEPPDLPPVVRVPDPDGPISEGRGEPRAIGAVGRGEGDAPRPAEQADLLAGLGVPDPDGTVPVGRGDPAAVGVEGQSERPGLVTAQRAERAPRGRVPELHRPADWSRRCGGRRG